MLYFWSLKHLYHWLRNHFGFSKSESNGFVILIPLMLISSAAPFLWRHYDLDDDPFAKKTNTADSLIAVLENRIEIKKEKEREKNWHNYQYKTNPSHEEKRAKDNEHSRGERVEEKSFTKKARLSPFDINKADTSTLKKIYGIGPVLSNRIVKYRDLLGGFVNKDQLREVYGLKDEALQKLDSMCFVKEDFVPKRLSINTAKSYILDDHPYISKKVADAIDAYRFQHGKIDTVSTLYQLHLLDSATVKKIYPYLSF